MQSFSAPFGEINTTARPRSRTAVIAGLQRRSPAALSRCALRDPGASAVLRRRPRARRGRIALGRRRSLRRRGKGRATRDRGRIEAPRRRHEAEARALCRGGALLRDHAAAEARRFRSKRSTQEYAAELAALQRAGVARRPVARGQTAYRRHDHRGDAASRRPDGGVDALRPAGARARLSVLRQFHCAGLQFAVARTPSRHGDLAHGF